MTVTSCDPGEAAPAPQGEAGPVLLALPAARATFALTQLTAGVDQELARGVSANPAERFAIDELTDPAASALEPEALDALTADTLHMCRQRL